MIHWLDSSAYGCLQQHLDEQEARALELVDLLLSCELLGEPGEREACPRRDRCPQVREMYVQSPRSRGSRPLHRVREFGAGYVTTYCGRRLRASVQRYRPRVGRCECCERARAR